MQQQQQLEIVTAQLSGNGWQIIAAGPATTKESVAQHQGTSASSSCSNTITASAATTTNGNVTSVQDSSGLPIKARPIVSAAGQYNVVPVQSLPNTTMVVNAAATAGGSSNSIQYQIIPQLQTVDGQQIQISSANLQQDLHGQIQIFTTGHGQTALIGQQTRTTSASTASPSTVFSQSSASVPIQIRPGLSIPLQLQGINISGTQSQMVATLPINIGGGVTLAVPINSLAAASGGGTIQFVQPFDGGVSNGNQMISTPISTASLSSMPESPSSSPPSSSTSTCVTTASPSLSCVTSLANSSETAQAIFRTTSSSENIEDDPSSAATEGEGTNLSQSNGLQNMPEHGQFHQVQLAVGQQVPIQQQHSSQIQQQIIQTIPQHALQAIQSATVPGQTIQNAQLSTMQNPTQVIIRAPSLTPSGQINWQTIQLQNIQNLSGVQIQNAQQLAVTPVSSSNSGGTTIAQITPVTVTGGTINLSAAQLASVPNLQTVNIGSLSSGGVQVQGIPVAIANLAGMIIL